MLIKSIIVFIYFNFSHYLRKVNYKIFLSFIIREITILLYTYKFKSYILTNQLHSFYVQRYRVLIAGPADNRPSLHQHLLLICLRLESNQHTMTNLKGEH